MLKVIHSGKIVLDSRSNTYVLTQTYPSHRKLETLCSSIIIEKNENIRLQETRASTGSISLLLYNLLIMILPGTHSMSLLKDRRMFLKNWD